jgi:hypothetical protein
VGPRLDREIRPLRPLVAGNWQGMRCRGQMFVDILSLIARLRAPPTPECEVSISGDPLNISELFLKRHLPTR